MVGNNTGRMTWRELLVFLKQLESDTRLLSTGDPRLDDHVIVYDLTNGEYNPADIVEFDGNDDIISKNQLFIMSYDWNQHFDEENADG